jgi:hypothetical protein
VKKLEEAFPKPDEDLLITHEELQALIGEEKGSQRYYGVINSWRKKLFNELGIDTAWDPGEGVKILAPADRLHASEHGFKQHLRATKRDSRRLAATPRERLNDVGQQRYDHVSIVMAKIKGAIDTTQKQLAVELAPVKSLPKPKIVKTAG